MVFLILLLLASPAPALTCKQVKDAVSQYGEWAVTYWAKNNGYSEKQITEIKSRCFPVPAKRKS